MNLIDDMEGVLPVKDRITKALVKDLLENAGEREWTLQGLGMLRCYLEPELRLHVWNSRFKARGVSELHTHPWNLRGLVVAGELKNERLVEVADSHREALAYQRQTIRCGEGGGLEGEPTHVMLYSSRIEVVHEGELYSQEAPEIHRSMPEDGTVTLIEREFLDDTEHAYVYFRGEWGTAEPRPATKDEVDQIVGFSLGRWFGPDPVG